MYRGFLTLFLFCFLVTVAGPIGSAHAAENVIFVCAGSTTPQTAPGASEPKGFFARLFSREPEQTIVTIECSGGKLPEPVVPPPKPAAPKEEKGIAAAIRRALLPQSTPKTATPTGGNKGGATISKPLTREEQLTQIEKELAKTKTETEKVTKQVALFKEAERRSLYWGLVRVTLYTSRSQKPGDEVLIISVVGNAPKGTRVPLSTFHIADGHGESFLIPGGTKLPMPGLSNEKKDIVLEPGQSAVITTGSSPNGLSFMVNSCTGYFNQGNRFNPGLPSACPSAINEPWAAKLPPQCWDYIRTIRRCQTPTSLPLSLKPECQTAVAENTNYNACVDDHKSDKDFYKNEWRVYLNRRAPIFDVRYESASVVDAEGKLVWYKEWY